MTQTVSKKVFATELEKQQGRLNLLQRRAREKGVSTLLVFEGWDAAGKGGAIRRVTAALDAQDYQVIPIAAPTDEERAQHYLWRFWRHLSRAGRLTIFDRSWYGRVLVERVEGFATPAEWMRAYTEINEFEDQLVERGIVLVKFWVHVTLRRAAPPLQGAREARAQEVEADRRRLAEPLALVRVRARGQRHGRAHEHAAGAVDDRRGQRQELRAAEGDPDDWRSDEGRPALKAPPRFRV